MRCDLAGRCGAADAEEFTIRCELRESCPLVARLEPEAAEKYEELKRELKTAKLEGWGGAEL